MLGRFKDFLENGGILAKKMTKKAPKNIKLGKLWRSKFPADCEGRGGDFTSLPVLAGKSCLDHPLAVAWQHGICHTT